MITFDGVSKIITLSIGTVELSVSDLYSRWKDWILVSDNSKYLSAFSVVGGDDISLADGTKVPLYAFLENGWRIRPQEANHTLNVKSGILLVAGGGDPFINTIGSFVVRVNYQQPVQAITVNTAGGSSGPDADTIAAAVWNKLLASHTIPGSAGKTVQDTLTISTDMATDLTSISSAIIAIDVIVQTLHKYQKNRTRVDSAAKTLTIYDDDNTTPIKIFNLKDLSGTASITEIGERYPV